MAGGDHSVALTPSWRLWRLAAVRGAGMPLSWLAALAAEEGESEAALALLLEPRFLEALTWQNPAMVRNWVARHLADLRTGRRRPRPRNRRWSERIALLARYAQRYCAKNETIGFFGPVAWARFEEAASGLRQSGSGGLRCRSVHFEVWAMDALADAWSRNPDVRPHLIARLHPAATFDGSVLRLPCRRPERVGEADAAVLRLVDGRRSVRRIARALRTGPNGDADAGVRTDAEAEAATLAVLERWQDAGVLTLGFPIPIDEHPERHLRRHLEAVEDAALRDRLLAVLCELEQARDAVADAAGDPEALLAALDRLAGCFAAATGRPDSRSKQQTPTGRAAVYEDCRRDLDVTVGGDLLDALRAPLGLVLDTARWLVDEVADAVADELARRLKQLQDGAGSDEGRLDALLFVASGILAGSAESPVHEVAEDFQLRWGEILRGAGDGDGDPVALSSMVVTPAVRALFPRRPGPPRWAAARQHSPDLLLVPGGPGHGRRPLWVLGELHLALNTLENRVFAVQADDRRELVAATAADMAAGRLVPLYPKRLADVTSRTYPPLAIHVPDRYLYWSFDRDDGHPEGGPGLPATGLVVRLEDGELVAGPADGAWVAPLLEVLGEFLTALVVNRFRIRPAVPHAPRVTIDDLVVCRESWRFPAAAVPESPAALCRFLTERGIPRYVFAHTPAEPKPLHVDLAAPPLLANLLRAARRAVRSLPPDQAHLDLVEMLPGPSDLWLTDAAGDRYTAEFRMVAVDARERPAILRRRQPA